MRYFCYRCGRFSGMMGHFDKCAPNPELVALVAATSAMHKDIYGTCRCGEKYDEPHFANVIYDAHIKFDGHKI